MTSGPAPEPHTHAVTFYHLDDQVVDEVVRFIADGIDQQGRAVVVATPSHRVAILQGLRALGLDPDEPPAAGRLVLLDAHDTLRTFMTERGPDRDRFMAHVGVRVLDAGSDGAPVRVFGEMVGLLWESGDTVGATALEEMWNGFVSRLGFELLCAYPAHLIETSGLSAVRDVCRQHSHVQPPADDAVVSGTHHGPSRVFLPVPEAVASSRRFVIGSLRRLGADHLVQDAALIVSELASNAVLHARSPFRVSVDHVGGVVRIAVQDVGAGQARRPGVESGESAVDGRGIAIVEALARRWGSHPLSDGKVVWAELAA